MYILSLNIKNFLKMFFFFNFFRFYYIDYCLCYNVYIYCAYDTCIIYMEVVLWG